MEKMRKILALSMVAILSLTVALAAIGCNKKTEDEGSTTTTTTTTTETTTMSDTGMGMPDTSMADTSMHH